MFGLSALGFAGDLLGGGSGNDPGKKQLKEVKGVYGGAKSAQAYGNARALSAFRQARPAVQNAYAKARGYASSGMNAAYTGARDAYTQELGALDERMQSRGLYNSTVYDNARAGLSGQLSRRLMEIESLFSDQLGGLAVGEGNALAGLASGEASLIQGQTGQTVGLLQDYAATLAGVQHEDPNAWIKDLLGMGAQLGSAALIASDRRLKCNIERVGVSPGGVPIYEFEYRALRGPRYRGVMADDVPHAAIRGGSGYLYVDYDKVDVPFERVA